MTVRIHRVKNYRQSPLSSAEFFAKSPRKTNFVWSVSKNFLPLICDIQLNSSPTQEFIPRNHRIWHYVGDFFLFFGILWLGKIHEFQTNGWKYVSTWELALHHLIGVSSICNEKIALVKKFGKLELKNIFQIKRKKLTVLKFAPLCSQYVNLAFCGILLHLCQFWLSNKNLQNLRISDNDKWRQMMGDRKRCRSQLLEKLTFTEKDSIFLQEFSYYKCKSKIFIGKVS